MLLAVLVRTMSATLGAVQALATMPLAADDVLPRPSRSFLYEPQRPGARSPLLDVYLPVGEPRGWVLVIHGGGFTTGRRNMKPSRVLAQKLLSERYLVFSVDYPLVRGAITVWEQVDSVVAAIDQARGFVERFHRPAARHGALLGSSAGATLALLAAARRRESLSLVISAFGLYDFTELEGLLLAFFRRTVLGTESPALSRAASPQFGDQPLPPVVLLHGTADRLVPVSQSERMSASLRARGVPVTSFVYPGAAHAFFNAPRSAVCRKALEDIAQSLATWAQPQPPDRV